jgi:DNA invertase Pin-like site-specific DNA recombinase
MSYPDDPIRQKFFRIRYDGGTLAQAAFACGISQATARRWIEEAKAEDEIRRTSVALRPRSAGWNPRAGRRDPRKRRPFP